MDKDILMICELADGCDGDCDHMDEHEEDIDCCETNCNYRKIKVKCRRVHTLEDSSLGFNPEEIISKSFNKENYMIECENCHTEFNLKDNGGECPHCGWDHQSHAMETINEDAEEF